MLDKLAIINKVIEEHQTIKAHVKLVGDSLTDQEALGNLEKARADWIPGRPEKVAEMCDKLQQTVGFLAEGLKNHFDFEEEVLPPLLGEALMQALFLEHEDIREAVSEARALVAELGLEEMGRGELMARESQVHEVINDMCQLVDEHAAREEVILGMVRRGLEEKGSD